MDPIKFYPGIQFSKFGFLILLGLHRHIEILFLISFTDMHFSFHSRVFRVQDAIVLPFLEYLLTVSTSVNTE